MEGYILTMEKVTVSLPAALLNYADRRARVSNTSRSRVIADALAERKAREEEALAVEGYRFYAEESREFAASSLDAVTEAIDRAS
ncbi:MAG: hypothetical protein ACYC3V_21265 [Chloroflexota bacterium]